MIHAYRGVFPKVHPSAFVEASAHVTGDVELGEESSVWFNTVTRRSGSCELIHRSARKYIALGAEYRAAAGA